MNSSELIAAVFVSLFVGLHVSLICDALRRNAPEFYAHAIDQLPELNAGPIYNWQATDNE